MRRLKDKDISVIVFVIILIAFAGVLLQQTLVAKNSLPPLWVIVGICVGVIFSAIAWAYVYKRGY